jgi:hypothetical protein
MSVTFHGDRIGDRAAGRPRTAGLSSRDPVVAARLARSIAMKGEWRTLPHRDDKRKILAAIGAQARWAVLALPAEATELLPALGKDLSQGCCHWGAAAMQRSPGLEPPRTEVLLALLGNPCGGCRRRWANAEAAAAAAATEAEHLADLTAGGTTVESAGAALERARRLVGRRAPAAPTVRDQIRLARERQRAREVAYSQPGRPR